MDLVGKGRHRHRNEHQTSVQNLAEMSPTQTIDAPRCIHATYKFLWRSNNQRLKNKNQAVFYDAIDTQ